jgi:hypothetical protein
MENFFNWVTKPIPKEDVEVWFSVNNLILEKSELFYDFCYSLVILMKDTYLGEETSPNETKILLNDTEKLNHFNWCWKTTIDGFFKENIRFNLKGEHYDYFSSFFMEIFYNQKNITVRDAIPTFLSELFDRESSFTKSDLDLYTELYKILEKNITH